MKKKKNIHVHVLAINTHVFLLKYMFIKFKNWDLNEWMKNIYNIFWVDIM